MPFAIAIATMSHIKIQGIGIVLGQLQGKLVEGHREM